MNIADAGENSNNLAHAFEFLLCGGSGTSPLNDIVALSFKVRQLIG